MVMFFNRQDPFEAYPALSRQYFRENACDLSLRYVNIISDLNLIYQWLRDPRLLTNSGLQKKKLRLIRYFRQSGESDSRKSFLVENACTAVCQFDISLINTHELYFRMPTSKGDCILTYLLTAQVNSDALFKNALRLQLDYFFSFPEPQRIWASIPDKQHDFRQLFLQTGFSVKSAYTAREERYIIFYLKRGHYLSLRPALF